MGSFEADSKKFCVGICRIRQMMWPGRFSHPCCRQSFLELVRESIDKPLNTLLSVDFLHCHECATIRRGERPQEQLQQNGPQGEGEANQMEVGNKRKMGGSSIEKSGKEEDGEQEHQSDKRIKEHATCKKRKSRRAIRTQRKKSRVFCQGTSFLSPPKFIPGNQISDLTMCHIVASRLPLFDLIRARCVCRVWRDSIFSSPNLNSFSNPDCQRPRLVVEHSSPQGASLAAFDPCLDRWSVIPIPSFGHLVAASGGLFCFVLKAGRPPLLVVGNPLTKRWKHLPAIPLSVWAHGPEIVAMTTDRKAGSYKVMALFGLWNDDASDAYLPFLYDSTIGGWEMRSVVPARHSFCTFGSVVKLPDTLFSLDADALSIFSYDMTRNTCSTKLLQHIAPQLSLDDAHVNSLCRLPQIANCNNRLFLVARCLEERRCEYKVGQLPIVLHSSVGIWVMQPDFGEWEFVTMVPPDLLARVVKGSDGTDFIIASNGCNQIYLILKGGSNLLAYDTISSNWLILSGCPADYTFYPHPQKAFYEALLWTALV